MARNQKHYDTDYKVQAVTLAKEIGLSKAARELGLAPSTLNGWIKPLVKDVLFLPLVRKHLVMQCLLQKR